MTEQEVLSLAIVGLTALFGFAYRDGVGMAGEETKVRDGGDREPAISFCCPVVWVTVGIVQLPRTLWTYWLSEGRAVSPSYGPLFGRGNATYMLCYSYTELFTCLRIICRETPPPRDYFTPTRKEVDHGAKWIVRCVVPFLTDGNTRSSR